MYYILEFKILNQPYFAKQMEVLEHGQPFNQDVLRQLNDGISFKDKGLSITFPKGRGQVSSGAASLGRIRTFRVGIHSRR